MRRLLALFAALPLAFAPADPAADPPVDATVADAAIDQALQDATAVDALVTDAAIPEPDAARPDPDAMWIADASPPDAQVDPPPQPCEVAGPTPLRRLTPTQYRNTARALGLPDVALDLSAEAGPIISQLGSERFMAAAAELAQAADVSVAGVLPCDPLEGEDLCAAQLIAGFADAAFRRAPSEAEIEWLTVLWDAAPGDFADRARLIIEVVLQSPQVIYRFERALDGVLDAAGQAERLAFALTDAPPDAQLRAADLSDPAVRDAEARRLAASAGGRETLRRFLMRWADIERVGDKVEPFSSSAAIAESSAFVDRIVNEDGTFADLMTDRSVALDPGLAALYGVPPDAVELPVDERAGLLTRVAFLAAHAGPVTKSPIQRGVFVRAQLLCAPLPPPPPTVDNTPIQRGGRADDGRARSIRQFTAIRTAGRDCAGCHDLINPAGFVFEHYDVRGRFVRDESGVDRFGDPYTVPIDAAAEILGADFEPAISDAVALSHAIAGSDQVHACLVEHWLRAVYQRDLTAADDCDLEYLRDTFARSGGRLSVLLTATARLAGMRLKAVEE